MVFPRHLHTATPLASGKVLIVGGESADPLAVTAEIYDPNTGTFTATGSLVTTPGFFSAAALLPDGTVLVADGSYAELFNPATGMFSETGGLQIARSSFALTALGKNSQALVLVTGGSPCPQLPCPAAAELYQ